MTDSRRITITRYANEGEYYAPGLFAQKIGKPVPIHNAPPEWAGAVLVEVKVHRDQQGVDLTFEIPE